MSRRYWDRIDVLRAPEKPGHGGRKVRDWAAAEEGPPHLTDVPADVQPATSEEDTNRQQLSITRWRVHCGPDVDLVATDRVRWRGRVLEVDGEVGLFMSHGRPHHLEVVVRGISEQ